MAYEQPTATPRFARPPAPRGWSLPRDKRRLPKLEESSEELVIVEHLYRELLQFVEEMLESGEDLDIADAIANAEPAKDREHMRVKLDAEQLDRLAGWLVSRSAYFERAHIEVANRAVELRAQA